jgi:signal transduction histidine kinase
MLFNLVGNAVKFTTEGYIELKVKKVFYSDRSKMDLIFSVKDTGIGISQEDRKIIFDAFQQS